MGAAVVTTRTAKGSALTTTEMDDNFNSAWNKKELATDFSNGTITQTLISDGTTSFTWTPPANTDIEIEAELIVQAVATANLPSIQASVPAGMQYGFAEVTWASSATAKAFAIAGFTTSAVTATIPAGTAMSATVPFRVTVFIKGRTGASPAAININGAGESAATNAIIVKAGSAMRYRVV
jgi:hypothetical protein